MLLRLTLVYGVLCVFGQVNSTPTFGTNQSGSGGGSVLGNIFRWKAQLVDNIHNHFHQALRTGTGGRTGVGFGVGAGAGAGTGTGTITVSAGISGSHYGGGTMPRPAYGPAIAVPSTPTPPISGVIPGAPPTAAPAYIVPSTPAELILAVIYQGYLDATVAQTLAYVSGRPEYLFQYVNELGQIMPITGELAALLSPSLTA